MKPTRSQRALGIAWYALIPALTAGVVFKHGFPRSTSGDAASVALTLRDVRANHPTALALGLFVALSLCARYWRFRLPGGRYLAALPPELAERVPRDALPELDRAARTEERVARPRVLARIDASLTGEDRERFAVARRELADALQTGDRARSESAERALSRLAGAELRRASLIEAVGVVATIGLAALAALELRRSVVGLHRVEGSSMLPTLSEGDLLVTNRLAYGKTRAPQRGDIIVLRGDLPGAPSDLVKRVVGLPGDHVEMRRGLVTINGWAVPSCEASRYVRVTGEELVDGRLVVEFLGERAYLTLHTLDAIAAEPYDVKPGEVFVLGDNRNQSLDSRVWNHGKAAGLPLERLEGRVERLIAFDLSGTHPSARALVAKPDLFVDAPELDTAALTLGIERCLANRPSVTTPPPSGRGR